MPAAVALVWLVAFPCQANAQRRLEVPQFDLLPEVEVPEPPAPGPRRHDPWTIVRPPEPALPAPPPGPKQDFSPWTQCNLPQLPEDNVRFCTDVVLDDKESIERRAAAYLARAYARERQFLSVLAIADLTDAIELDPKLALAYYRRGALWQRERNHDAALRDFNEALKLQPRDAALFVARGTSLRAKKNLPAAIRDFDRAIALNKSSEAAYYERALVHLDQGKPEAALQDLQASLKLNAKIGTTYYALGNVYRALGQKPQAQLAFDKAVQTDPTLELFVLAAKGEAYLQDGDCKAALDQLDRALKINPRSPPLLNNRAACLRKTGRFEEAIRDLNIAIAIVPNNPELFTGRGLAFLSLRERNKAQADFDLALKVKPDFIQALRYRGQLFLAAQDFPRATSDLERASRDASNPDVIAEYGFALLIAGDNAGANKQFERALQINADHPLSVYGRGYLKRKDGDVSAGETDMVLALRKQPEILDWLDSIGFKL